MSSYLDGNGSTPLFKNKDKPTKKELAMKATREKWARNNKRAFHKLKQAQKKRTTGSSGG